LIAGLVRRVEPTSALRPGDHPQRKTSGQDPRGPRSSAEDRRPRKVRRDPPVSLLPSPPSGRAVPQMPATPDRPRSIRGGEMSPGGDLVRPEPDTQLRVQLPRSLLTFYARPGWPPNRSPPQSAGCTTATRCARSLPEAAVPAPARRPQGCKGRRDAGRFSGSTSRPRRTRRPPARAGRGPHSR